MKGGTLVVSRGELMFPRYEDRFNELGFEDVMCTAAEKDGLNYVINEKKPNLVIVSSRFYQAGTPYMAGEIKRNFPKLNIAAVSLHDYPLAIAPWFVWHGVKSYLNMWEVGYKEFHKALQLVRRGGRFISPKVEKIIDYCGEWPDVKNKATKRQMECLVMLCCGFTPEHIGENLHLSRPTINNNLAALYKTFHVGSREEMVALAWELGLVTKNDIQFFDDRPKFEMADPKAALPEWAVVKRKCNTFINNFYK